MKLFTVVREFNYRAFISRPIFLRVDAIKEVGLEVNGEETRCMVMTRDQNVGTNHGTQTRNTSFESVEQVRYLAANLTYQNSIPEEIKSRLNSGNACYYSAQNHCLPVCYLKI